MSSKESTTTNSSDGGGTAHHSLRGESVQRSLRSSTLPPSDRNAIMPPLSRSYRKPSNALSIRSRSSGDGSSIGSSQSQRPMTVTYKSKTTTGMLFSKKTTTVDCGVFVKEPDGYVLSSISLLFIALKKMNWYIIDNFFLGLFDKKYCFC